VQPADLERRIEEVAALNKKLKGFRVLVGSEINIGTDGSVDYDADVLERLDWVVASVHSSFRMGRDRMTKRVMTAMENPLVDVIGHPTGRKLLRRAPYDLDIEQIVAKASDTGTMIEIDGAPDRRDLNDHNARLAAEAGVPIVVDSDAHSAGTLALISYGVATARRAWLTAEDVANTRTWAQLKKMRARNRK
jgi:DNA polymerase (family X)